MKGHTARGIIRAAHRSGTLDRVYSIRAHRRQAARMLALASAYGQATERYAKAVDAKASEAVSVGARAGAR